MEAKIKYVMQYIPHPWDAEKSKNGEKAYCLIREVVASKLIVSRDPVAIFSLDSEGVFFCEEARQGPVKIEVL